MHPGGHGSAWGLLIAVGIASGASAQDGALDDALREAFEAGELAGLHSVLVVHEGEILAESHFAGEDQRWGAPLGERQHGPDTLHDLRSVTKSVVSLLYGIALAEGEVPAIDESLIEQFPEYADLAEDPARQAILIRHALSTKMGTEWIETFPIRTPGTARSRWKTRSIAIASCWIDRWWTSPVIAGTTMAAPWP